MWPILFSFYFLFVKTWEKVLDVWYHTRIDICYTCFHLHLVDRVWFLVFFTRITHPLHAVVNKEFKVDSLEVDFYPDNILIKKESTLLICFLWWISYVTQTKFFSLDSNHSRLTVSSCYCCWHGRRRKKVSLNTNVSVHLKRPWLVSISSSYFSH